MKKTVLFFFFFFMLTMAQSLTLRQLWYNGKIFLVVDDYTHGTLKHKFFVINMETGIVDPDTSLARNLYNGNIKEEILTGKDAAVITSLQKYKITMWREKRPGSLYYRDIVGFDKILSMHEDVLSKKRKEDKKNNRLSGLYKPEAVVLFNNHNNCYYLFTDPGIYYVHQDSLDQPAKTAFEFAGLQFKRFLTNPYGTSTLKLLVLEMQGGRSVYRSFDMKRNTILRIAGLDEMTNLSEVTSPTSSYILFSGRKGREDSPETRTVLVNYETGTVEALVDNFLIDGKESCFLHKGTLYIKREYLSGGWQFELNGYDLTMNGKRIFSYKKQ